MVTNVDQDAPCVDCNLRLMSFHSIPNPPTTAPTGNERAPALMLAAFLDLEASYSTLGPDSTATAAVKGLRLETRVAAPSTPLLTEEHAQRSHSVVLEPCSMTVEYSQRARAGSKALDVHADVSSIVLRLSPDVLRLLLSAQRILQPFAVPSPNRCGVNSGVNIACVVRMHAPNQHASSPWSTHLVPHVAQHRPFARVSVFELLWSTDEGTREAATSTTVTGANASVSLWQPQVPGSYVSLGSVALAGPGPPSFQVLAVAVNSGFVAYPTAFTRVWSDPGVSVWAPQPPADYVAIGYVAVRGTDAPSITSVGCLHRHVVVHASMGQVRCIGVPHVSTHRLQELRMRGAGQRPVIQCFDNALATFRLQTDDHTPGRMLTILVF